MALGPKGVVLGWTPFVEEGDQGGGAARTSKAGSRAGVREPRDRTPLTHAPEPPFTHDRTPRIGVLLTNLGTPDAPTAGGGTALPRAISRPTRGWSRSRRWAWKPILHGVILHVRPAQSAREIRGDLDQGRLAAPRAQHCASGRCCWAFSGSSLKARRIPRRPVSGRDRHALRQSGHRRGARQAARRALREDPRAAALSAIRGEHDGVDVRCGGGASCAGAARCRGCVSSRRSTATTATSRRWRRTSTTTG